MGAAIGFLGSYLGCKKGAKTSYELMKKDKAERLKNQLVYLVDLFTQSTSDFGEELGRGQEHIDSLVWQENTLLFDNNYKEELLYAQLNLIEIQDVLKWFSSWEIIDKKFKADCQRIETHQCAGCTVLKECRKEKEKLQKLLPKVKKVIHKLNK